MSQPAANYSNPFIRARAWYQQADALRWRVAWIAYKTMSRKEDVRRLADAIGRNEDTVYRLARAYRMFVMLLKHDSALVRKLRRAHPYTRFAVVFNLWNEYEFSLDDAAEWIGGFEGGNAALEMQARDKYDDAPEWERRADSLYKMADKLRLDFAAPEAVKNAAIAFVQSMDEWRKEQQ